MATILAVDDSAAMRQMVAHTLQGAGHEVIEAVNGLDALGKAQLTKFDLVISDVNMPNMDGVSLLKKLRAFPEFKLTPMLMLTSESAVDKQRLEQTSDATGWIMKPFNTEQLIATINKYFDSKL